MLWRNTKDRFGLIHKGFHWIMAVIILLMLSVGFWMAGLPFSPFKLEIYALHKSFGVLILMLLTGRILWRLFDRRPKPVPTLKWWEDALAKLVHLLLYFAIFSMCMTGLNMSAAAEFPVPFFGLFEIPPMIGKNEETFRFLRDMHELWALVIIGLLFLHFSGAFKHHLIDKDDTLRRMTTMKLGIKGGIALAIVAAILWIKPVSLFVQGELGADDAASSSENTQTQVQQESEGAWHVDKDASSIKFTAQQYGTPFEGQFSDFDSAIMFDPDDLAKSNVAITIKTGSIKTGSDDRDAQAKSKDWFDENSFGKATFESHSFERKDPNHFVAHGVLMLHGVAKPIDLPFTLDITGDTQKTAEMRAEITLNRLDFGIGQGEWSKTDTIGGDVKVLIYVKANRDESP